jgi:hypothetical protein
LYKGVIKNPTIDSLGVKGSAYREARMCGCFDYGREGVAVWWGLVGKHESEEVKSFLVLSKIEVGSY